MVGEYVDDGRPNMVLASTYVPPDGAAAAYLLHRWLSARQTTRTWWHSIFTNSSTEAIATVLKFCRNRQKRVGDGGSCKILVFDRTGNAEILLGHEVPGLRASVDDATTIVADVEAFLTLAPAAEVCLVVADGLEPVESWAVRAAVSAHRERGGLVAWGVLSRTGQLPSLPAAAQHADLVFLGEACTGGAYPAGTVSFRRQTFALWNNPLDCVAHVSTFAGNAVALAQLRQTITDLHDPDRRELDELRRIQRSDLARRARLRMHGNTWQTRAIDIAGINLTFEHAYGVTYTIGSRQYTDLASGAGPAWRGHNRMSSDRIHAAGSAGTESAALETKLAQLTGLEVMLPAVSGATAVDAAVLAALAASPGRHTIVTIRGNYSGKGALSAALSRTSNHFRDKDRFAFSPYPVRVLELDPEDESGIATTLARSDVAMVWLELVQGLDCEAVPQHVIDAIERHRVSGGYLVGCDEVLTGFWRTHRSHFLCAGGRGLRPDVVALSKALSDALVPVGAAMVSADVFDSAARHAPGTARWLRDVHRNDMAAGVALAAIEDGEGALQQWDVLATGLEECLRVATTSEVFGGYRRHGLLSRLILAPDLLGSDPDPSLVDHCEAVVTRFIADRCSAITLQLRILPAITSENADTVLAALDRVSEVLSRLRRPDVFRALGWSVAGIAARESSTTVLRTAARWRDRPVPQRHLHTHSANKR